VKWADKANDARKAADKTEDFSKFFRGMDDYPDFMRAAERGGGDMNFVRSWRGVTPDNINALNIPVKWHFDEAFEAFRYGNPGGSWYAASKYTSAADASRQCGIPLSSSRLGGYRVLLLSGDYWVGTSAGWWNGAFRYPGGATQLKAAMPHYGPIEILESWRMW